MGLAALAQRDGAYVIWCDLESSFAPKWALQRGLAPCPACKGEAGKKNGIACDGCGGSLDVSLSPMRGLDAAKLLLIQPFVGRFSHVGKDGKMHKEKEDRLAYGQELLAEVEAGMTLPGHDKRMVVLDSVAAVLPEGEAKAGIDDMNMRTDMDLPKLMSRLLRRWVGRAQVHNVMIALVSQLREGPGGFGSNEKTSGGNAPKFYAHVRVRVRRVKGGRIIQSGKLLGITGIMKAVKNKQGGQEGKEIGYQIMFKGPLKFIPAAKAKVNEVDR